MKNKKMQKVLCEGYSFRVGAVVELVVGQEIL